MIRVEQLFSRTHQCNRVGVGFEGSIKPVEVWPTKKTTRLQACFGHLLPELIDFAVVIFFAQASARH